MAYINYKNFSLPKLNTDINQWADHIEFLCFLSQETYISVQQIVDRILDENSNDSNLAIHDIAEEDEISELKSELNDETQIAEDEIIDESQNSSAMNDKISSKVKIIFNLLQSRKEHYLADYPFFFISDHEILLKENLTVFQRIYIILLCSSLLRLATKSGINKIGHLFEQLCGPVFKQLLPTFSDAHFFGSGGTDSSIFKGKFYDKVIELCNRLHVAKRSNFKSDYVGINNVGDGGLDWVGIFNFGDNQSSQPVFFGQCACGSDWIEKEFDAHKSKWNNYIQFDNGYLTYHFIPRNYRDNSLRWFNPLDIHDVVLIDRYRIMELLKKLENLSDIISIYTPLFEEFSVNKIDAFS